MAARGEDARCGSGRGKREVRAAGTGRGAAGRGWRGLAALAALAGCVDDTEVAPEEVLQVIACPPGTPCEAVADGQSRVTVEACVPEAVEPRAAPLALTMRLSAGAWLGAGEAAPSLFQADLSRSRCAQAAFVTTTSARPVHVEATLVGVVQAVDVPLSPAALTEVVITPSGAALERSGESELSLTAEVRCARGGAPTEGTEVAFSAQVKPEGVPALFLPDRAAVAGRAATTTLFVGPGATSVTITAVAAPPPSEGGAEGKTVEDSLTLRASP